MMDLTREQTRAGSPPWRHVGETILDLRAMLAEIGVRMALRANARDLFLDLHITPETPRYFLGQSDVYRALLVITSSHCLRTIEQGGVTITVRSTPLLEEGMHRLDIVVTGTGHGIVPDKGHASSMARFARRGGNLATIERLTRRLNGSLSVFSSFGWGTRYEIRLASREAAPFSTERVARDMYLQ